MFSKFRLASLCLLIAIFFFICTQETQGLALSPLSFSRFRQRFDDIFDTFHDDIFGWNAWEPRGLLDIVRPHHTRAHALAHGMTDKDKDKDSKQLCNESGNKQCEGSTMTQKAPESTNDGTAVQTAFSYMPVAELWDAHMDIVENDNNFTIALDVPGVPADAVKVEVHEGVLSISGHREQEHKEETAQYKLLERSFGSFSRHLRLPKDVDADHITAQQEHGVLRLTLPKLAKPAAAPAPKRIPVTQKSTSSER